MTKTEYKSYEKTLNYDDHCACRFAPSQAAEFNLAAYAEFDLVAPFIICHNLLTLLSPLGFLISFLCYVYIYNVCNFNIF